MTEKLYIASHTVCGMAAFLYTEEPLCQVKILRENARHLDRSHFHPREKLTHCESCGQPLRSGIYLSNGGPVLKTYNAASTADMRELYNVEWPADRGFA